MIMAQPQIYIRSEIGFLREKCSIRADPHSITAPSPSVALPHRKNARYTSDLRESKANANFMCISKQIVILMTECNRCFEQYLQNEAVL